MVQIKTPGVYINEISAFPNSVVEVATAVPAFVGYTQKAHRGAKGLTGVPVRVSTFREFEGLFGGAPNLQFDWNAKGKTLTGLTLVGRRFYLYWALQHFFLNGGGPCWIVSVGGYDAPGYDASDFTDGVWEALAKEPEPTVYIAPDAVALVHKSYVTISNRMLAECQTLQDRVAILDVYDGRGPDTEAAINGPKGFRNALNFGANNSYGAVYYPWLNTEIVDAKQVSLMNLSPAGRVVLSETLTAELRTRPDKAERKAEITGLIGELTDDAMAPESAALLGRTLASIFPTVTGVLSALRHELNILPPSGAMAGVWTRTDTNEGVWKAPANTSIVSVVSPTITITTAQQQDLNVPMDGLAVNAIRTFAERGVLVWGARTLDGNSQDWRYISVRRTMIMLEQSIKLAVESYVFAPNDAGTWRDLQTMIENFLNTQWQAGALAGAKPSDAYGVAVGLGSTMTGKDILDGYIRVTVHVAVTRPAEFIVFTFQQKMQTS